MARSRLGWLAVHALGVLVGCNVQSGTGAAPWAAPPSAADPGVYAYSGTGRAEPPNRATGPVTLKANVQVLRDDVAAAAVLQGDTVLVPRAGNDDLLGLKPGDVLVSRSGAGFLRKVVAAPTLANAPTGGTSTQGLSDLWVSITTVAASLTDAIADAEFDFALSVPPLDANADGYVVAEEPMRAGQMTLSFTTADIRVTPQLRLRGAIHGGNVQSVEVEYDDVLSVTDVVRLTAMAAGTLSGEKPVWQSAPIPVDLAIGPIPIVSTLRFAVLVGASATFKGEAEIEAGETCNRTRKIVTRWAADDGWTHDVAKATSCSAIGPDWSLQAEASAGANVSLRAEWSFVGIGGLQATLDGRVDAKASLCDEPKGWALSSTIAGTVSAELSPFGVPAGAFSAEVFSEDTEIASGGIPTDWSYVCAGCPGVDLSGTWTCGGEGEYNGPLSVSQSGNLVSMLSVSGAGCVPHEIRLGELQTVVEDGASHCEAGPFTVVNEHEITAEEVSVGCDTEFIAGTCSR